MVQLSINLNKIALLRNQRDIGYPDPVAAGAFILDAGANGLTLHPRPDERHIRRTDIPAINNMMRVEGWFAKGCELNIEGFPSQNFIELILENQPQQVSFVPDAPDQRTSDHGWDLSENHEILTRAMARLKQDAPHIRISLFMDIIENIAFMQQQFSRAKEIGADAVELYTEPFAVTHHSFLKNADQYQHSLNELCSAIQNASAYANEIGLRIHAGHDLNLHNLAAFKIHCAPLHEVSIGHAFTADALWFGFSDALQKYKAALAT